MKLIIAGLFLSLLIDTGFSKRTKKLPPGADHMAFARQGPEDDFTPHFFTWVGTHPDVFIEVFLKHIPDDDKSEALSVKPENWQDTRCDGCIVSFISLQLLG